MIVNVNVPGQAVIHTSRSSCRRCILGYLGIIKKKKDCGLLYTPANMPAMCKLCRLFPDLCDAHVSELCAWEAWPPASSVGRNLLCNVTNMKGAFRNVFFLKRARD